MGRGAKSKIQDWPLMERPGFLARRLHQIHVSLFAEFSVEFGLTPLQYSLLSVLSGLEETDQTTLANRVALDRTTTTGGLKRLESRGLIRRRTSPSDRRAQTCAITAKGLELLDIMDGAVKRAHKETLQPLNVEEQKKFLELLCRIVGHQEERRAKVS
jgi:DNA-binding MarR family transcriptional regulator